jgi:membrane protease YdiL (CAAX protease family)
MGFIVLATLFNMVIPETGRFVGPPLGSPLGLPQLNVFPVLLMGVTDEMIFRGLWFRLTGKTYGDIVCSALTYGVVYYFFILRVPATLMNMTVLGWTYGLASRKYALGELCMYHTLLNVIMLKN